MWAFGLVQALLQNTLHLVALAALLQRRDHLLSLRVRQFRHQFIEPLQKLAMLHRNGLLPNQNTQDARRLRQKPTHNSDSAKNVGAPLRPYNVSACFVLGAVDILSAAFELAEKANSRAAESWIKRVCALLLSIIDKNPWAVDNLLRDYLPEDWADILKSILTSVGDQVDPGKVDGSKEAKKIFLSKLIQKCEETVS